MNSFSFIWKLFIWKFFIFLSYLKDSLPGVVFLVCSFFSFEHFEYIIPFSSGWQGFWWEITDCFLEAPFYVTSCFSFAAFKILSLFLISDNYNMSWCRSPWVILFDTLCTFWTFRSVSFAWLIRFKSLFLKIGFLLLSLSLSLYLLELPIVTMLDVLPEVTWTILIFVIVVISFLFPLLFLGDFH